MSNSQAKVQVSAHLQLRFLRVFPWPLGYTRASPGSQLFLLLRFVAASYIRAYECGAGSIGVEPELRGARPLQRSNVLLSQLCHPQSCWGQNREQSAGSLERLECSDDANEPDSHTTVCMSGHPLGRARRLLDSLLLIRTSRSARHDPRDAE
ncbi:hypothetical protein GQ53DRAFT_76931 [Thozetella sp. PMI_491]|nr:hypothetical protein GQ53DRAFT_76931 [Thozetella sp. PMI_491]